MIEHTDELILYRFLFDDVKSTIIIVTLVICATVALISLARIKERKDYHKEKIEDAKKYSNGYLCAKCEFKNCDDYKRKCEIENETH